MQGALLRLQRPPVGTRQEALSPLLPPSHQLESQRLDQQGVAIATNLGSIPHLRSLMSVALIYTQCMCVYVYTHTHTYTHTSYPLEGVNGGPTSAQVLRHP